MDDKNHVISIDDPSPPKVVTSFTSDDPKDNHTTHGDTDDFPDSAEFAEKVRRILTDGDFDVDPEYLLNRHNLFAQMDVLCSFPGAVFGWKELSRWLKYEEKVDAGGRWSKPHVSTVSLRALNHLKFQLENDKIQLMLDLCTDSLTWDLLKSQIAQSVSSSLGLSAGARIALLNILNSPHKHKERNADSKNEQFVESMKQERSNSMRRKSFMKREGKDLWDTYTAYPKNITPGSLEKYQPNKKLKQKLPPDSEAANIMVGAVEFTTRPISFLCRFDPPITLGDATEVDLPTRFLFVALGVSSQSTLWQMCEMGRAMALLLTDKIFCEVAFKASGKEDLLLGMEEFMDDLTILPPSIWDPTIRLDPPSVTMTLERIGQRLQGSGRTAAKVETLTTEVLHSDESLQRSNRIFGGLKNDFKRRYPKMVSDVTDGFSSQCLASVIFLYFACITPIVTFGGLMASKTDGYMGTIEMLLAGAFCGTTYAMFSGQPLTIVGATGPLLVFESIIYEFCRNYSIPFLAFRFWVGAWIFLIMMFMVAFEMSSIVKYITRFTEESFAVLISVIFIYEAITKLFDIWHDNRIHTSVIHEALNYTCRCSANSSFQPLFSSWNVESTSPNSTLTSLRDNCWLQHGDVDVSRKCLSEEQCGASGGFHHGDGCVPSVVDSVPDVFLLSSILLFGTFALAISLRNFRSTRYFPSLVRSTVADFAVFLSLVTWTGVDYLLGLNTSKLNVPSTFHPTRDDRGWFVNPLLCDPWWLGLVAIVPALLATILIFLDQQITAVIVNRKENKLQKGHGYHLDLMVLSFQVLGCSFFGLPWFCAATVRSISHVKSLIRESEINAPGEAPKMLGIREQRMTGFIIHLLIGLSTLGAIFLKYVPMPVLYGVFLYMGITSLNGVQYIERIQILFMPIKYQPDFTFLRHVQTSKVHLFTLIQVLCSALMWAIKSFKVTSIGFPLMLVALVIIRKLMDYVFTQRNLYWLDNLLPESNIRKKEDQLRAIEFASQPSQRRRSTRVAENCFNPPGKKSLDDY